jgi:hypothetical protein
VPRLAGVGWCISLNFDPVESRRGLCDTQAAGLSDRVRALEEIVLMADNYLPKLASAVLKARRAPLNGIDLKSH